MNGEGMGSWTRRLREQPPAWPNRNDEPRPGRQRWLRDPEPFEDRGIFEPYPGATVLEDMTSSEDAAATLRILARYTVIRVLLLSASGRLRGPKLRTEQRIAREHLALLPAHDWERHALERLALLCGEEPDAAVLDAAVVAAEAAAKRGHAMGALGLYRAAYETARDAALWPSAARAAAGLERLARLNEAQRSARLWRWRAGVLEARALREAEAQAESAAAAAGAAERAGDGTDRQDSCD